MCECVLLFSIGPFYSSGHAVRHQAFLCRCACGKHNGNGVGCQHALPKYPSRVKDRQAERGQDDHDALEHHEQRLVVDEELAEEATGQLNAAIHAAYENGHAG